MGDLVKQLNLEVVDPNKISVQQNCSVDPLPLNRVQVFFPGGLFLGIYDSEHHVWGDGIEPSDEAAMHFYRDLEFGVTSNSRVVVNLIPELVDKGLFSRQEGNDLAHILYSCNNFNPFSHPDFVRERLVEQHDLGFLVRSEGSNQQLVFRGDPDDFLLLADSEGNVTGYGYSGYGRIFYRGSEI